MDLLTILLLLPGTDTFAEQTSSSGNALCGKVSVAPGFGCDFCMIGPILAPKPSQPSPRRDVGVWFCTLTARNRFDISGSQWNTSPIYGKVGNAVGLKSLSIISTRELAD